MIKHRIRPVAFYLPQFHPIPENDDWWGKGFTEWTNVVSAKPLFRGHYQPHLPADLGFYDLRLPEVRQAQADLAKEYGIYGFCYYHYWFNGRRMLERPFEEVLGSGQPDFPFCLCWANEDWTRAWYGREREVLIKQQYSDEDDKQHIRYLTKAFADRRYIRVADKPVFLVYHAARLPDPRKTTAIWREEAHRLGVGELYLCKVENSLGEIHADPTELGFDAAVEFQPDRLACGPSRRRAGLWRALWAVANRVGFADRVSSVYDYPSIAKRMLQRPVPPYKRLPCVMPSWDNTARRKTGASIFRNATPEVYGEWLKTVVEEFVPNSPEENLIFINAWNEWAEGNHLEPCQKWGRGYLEATRDALLTTREK